MSTVRGLDRKCSMRLGKQLVDFSTCKQHVFNYEARMCAAPSEPPGAGWQA